MGKTTTAFAFSLSSFVLSAQSEPVQYWRLDESAGTVAHGIPGGSNGDLQNGAQWDPTGGHHDGACRFDGVNDIIVLGPCDITTGTGAFSLSLWVKPDFVTGAERAIIAKTVGPSPTDHIWSLSFVSGTALRFRMRAGSEDMILTSAPSSLFGGVYYHIAATYDGAEMAIYLNGSVLATVPATGSIGYHPEGPATMGNLSTGAAPFSGWLDDVRIYDRALSGDEIIDILLGGELTTGIPEPRPLLLPNGKIQVPPGAWQSMTVLDAAGRAVKTATLNNTAEPVALDVLPAGLYLVCLQGEGQRRTWPVVMP